MNSSISERQAAADKAAQHLARTEEARAKAAKAKKAAPKAKAPGSGQGVSQGADKSIRDSLMSQF